MTNYQIIAMQSAELAARGVLKFTGKVLELEFSNGEIVEVPEVEPINTFAAWKKLGYHVKRGEHAKAVFPIWTYKETRRQEEGETDGDADGEQPQRRGKMYMKKAFWFTREQVEKITT